MRVVVGVWRLGLVGGELGVGVVELGFVWWMVVGGCVRLGVWGLGFGVRRWRDWGWGLGVGVWGLGFAGGGWELGVGGSRVEG